MNTYIVTATNHYFWQKLAVKARNVDSAEKKFAAFLATPSSQAEEFREWSDGEQEPRSHYVYSFDSDDIEEAQWADDELIRATSLIVKMIGSGGNG